MGGAAVDYVVDGVAKGVVNVLGGYGVGAAAGVGAGADDGFAQSAGEGAGDRVVGDADAHGAGGAEDGGGQAGDGVQDQGQRAGPEGIRQSVEIGGVWSGDEEDVVGLGEEEGEALVGASALHFQDSIEGFEGERVASQTIQGIGGVCYYPVAAEKLCRQFYVSLYIKRKHALVVGRCSGVKLD